MCVWHFLRFFTQSDHKHLLTGSMRQLGVSYNRPGLARSTKSNLIKASTDLAEYTLTLDSRFIKLGVGWRVCNFFWKPCRIWTKLWTKQAKFTFISDFYSWFCFFISTSGCKIFDTKQLKNINCLRNTLIHLFSFGNIFFLSELQ